MLITKQQLKDFNACEDGLNRFVMQTNDTDQPVEVSSLVGGHNTTGDLLWLAGETLPKERIVRFACDCALINIELIKPYTDKYQLIVNFLTNPDAAYAAHATEAAEAAARAADAAAYAAYAARAADAAAYAAYAADAAYAAEAADAARAAHAAADKPKVNEMLRELFKC